ncbi:MAG TPA: hydrogenase maturation nickel metallochaperone HypA [Phycicoccus sp.]|nr:hydrogenase maturation nickel metallochaperone HypA [Phycicoccus sp.]
MHELSLCTSIARIVEQARAGREVSAVNLTVGQLRQVVPDTLIHCWDIVTRDTPLAGAALVVDYIPVTRTCGGCGAHGTVAHLFEAACPQCGNAEVTLTGGQEFAVTSIDVRTSSATVQES